MTTMQCKKCGFKFDEAYRKCPVCGISTTEVKE